MRETGDGAGALWGFQYGQETFWARFQPGGLEKDTAFMPVNVRTNNGDVVSALPEAQPTRAPTPPPQIEITLENGRKLRVGDGVDAGFVLELARGLAA